MSRLEIVTKLQNIEERKSKFEDQLKAVKSIYFKTGEVRLEIETSDYTHQGVDSYIQFNQQLMIDYLKSEISQLTAEADKLVESLIPVSAK